MVWIFRYPEQSLDLWSHGNYSILLFQFVLFSFRNLFSYKLTKDEKPHLSLNFPLYPKGNFMQLSEAATETIFENICSFLPAPFFWSFPGGFMCSPNRYQFSRSTFLATEQIQIFQEHLFSDRTDTDFPGALIFWLPNRYRFSRNTFLATEQITIFQEAFFEYQRRDRQFPGRYPSPNRYFSIRSRWLLSPILSNLNFV